MPVIEGVLWMVVLSLSFLSSIGVRTAYKNGVTDGYGYAREPRNPGYKIAGEYLQKTMSHRWVELRGRAKDERHENRH